MLGPAAVGLVDLPDVSPTMGLLVINYSVLDTPTINLPAIILPVGLVNLVVNRATADLASFGRPAVALSVMNLPTIDLSTKNISVMILSVSFINLAMYSATVNPAAVDLSAADLIIDLSAVHLCNLLSRFH